MMVPKPEKGDRVRYRHGRADLPYATPDVVPGVVYEVLDDLRVVILAHDAQGSPIIERGQVGEPVHRLPVAVFQPGALERGSWCYVPGFEGRPLVEV